MATVDADLADVLDEIVERIAQRVAELLKPAPVKLSVAVDPAALGQSSRHPRCPIPNCLICP